MNGRLNDISRKSPLNAAYAVEIRRLRLTGSNRTLDHFNYICVLLILHVLPTQTESSNFMSD